MQLRIITIRIHNLLTRVEPMRNLISQRFLLAFALFSAFFAHAAYADNSRTVEGKFGPVTITGEPQRVVTLYEGALDASYVVGAKPLGAVLTRGGDGVASYLQEKAQGITLVGTSQENNLEAIIALEPDLILAANTLPEEQYRLLSTLAPTVASNVDMFAADAWRKEAMLFATALGQTDAMVAALAELDTRLDAVKDTVAGALPEGQRSALLARWMPQGPVVLAHNLFTTQLLAAVGFAVTDGGVVKNGRPHSSPMSQENLAVLDQDWLFMATINQEGESALAAAEKSPAFRRLNVVKNQQVVPVDGQIWTSANGVLAAHVVLDGIEKAVAKAQ